MSINRRMFLKNSTILMGGLLFQGHRNLNYFGEFANTNLKVIRDNFGIYSEKGGTIGWFADNDQVVVIDTQFPDSAKNFMTHLSQKSIQKINYLFNTHHHNDHTMGNIYLKDFSEQIIAHTNCPRLQMKQNKGTEAENQIVTAQMTFDDTLKIKLPDENISALHFGQAHTSGDIVIHLENNNIAHLGDLVFNNVYPYIDNSGECSVESWVDTLDSVIEYFDGDTKFIFGHAENDEKVIGSIEDVEKKRNYLEALFEFVSTEVNNGKSVDEIENSETLPGYEHIIERWEGAKKMNFRETAKQLI